MKFGHKLYVAMYRHKMIYVDLEEAEDTDDPDPKMGTCCCSNAGDVTFARPVSSGSNAVCASSLFAMCRRAPSAF